MAAHSIEGYHRLLYPSREVSLDKRKLRAVIPNKPRISEELMPYSNMLGLEILLITYK
jgi:hypothetical protein